MLATLLDLAADGLGRGRRGRRAERSLENPNLPLDDPQAWDDAGLLERDTDAGIRVGPESALKYAPVWQAVKMISGDYAKLPLDVYRRLKPAGREKDRRHAAFRLLRKRANDLQSAFRFKRTLAVHLLIWENGYGFIERDGYGRPIGLYNLLPDRTEARWVGGELWYVTETTHPDGSPWLRWLPAYDVIHVVGLTTNGVEGCPLVKKARHSWGLGLAQQKFASRFYASGGRNGGVLEVPAKASEEFAENLEIGWRKLYDSDDGWFKTVILRDGAKFHSATYSPADGQMVEATERQAREVARWFVLHPSRLGVQDSVSYNSMTEANQQYLDTTLDPMLVDLEEEAEAKLLDGDEDRYVEFNRAALLRLNPKDRAAVNAIGIRNGWRCPDEVREDENMNPRPDGRGGEFVDVARAKSPGGADKGENDKPRGDGKDPAEKEAARSGGPVTPPPYPPEAERRAAEPDLAHRRRRIVFHVGARARHKAKSARAWEDWIAGGLASHRAEARELLGDDAVVAGILERLRPTVEGVGHRDLPAAVDRLMTEIESEA